MDYSTTNSPDVVFQFGSFFRMYKDGRIERSFGTDFIPPSINSETGVSTKDVQISSDSDYGVTGRIFLPTSTKPNEKLPVVVYYHGGALLVGSPFCAEYHNHVTSLVNEANVMVVSVNYRLAPEHPVPGPYHDSWAALKWVASHRGGAGPEPWLRAHADLGRLFVAGDSAGANIAHNVAVQAGAEGLGGVKLSGVCLVHPYFGGGGVDGEWRFAGAGAGDDWRVNPAADGRLAAMGCTRVMVCLAERDHLRERGMWYLDTLRRSGWKGELEVFETLGEEHVFHLFNPGSDTAKAFVRGLAKFFRK